MNATDLLPFIPEKYRSLVLLLLALSPIAGRAIQALINGRGIKGLFSAIWLGTNTPSPTVPPTDPNATRKLVPLIALFCALSLTSCATTEPVQARLVSLAKADGKAVVKILGAAAEEFSQREVDAFAQAVLRSTGGLAK